MIAPISIQHETKIHISASKADTGSGTKHAEEYHP